MFRSSRIPTLAYAVLLASFAWLHAGEPTEKDLRETYAFSVIVAEKSIYQVSHILVADEATAKDVWTQAMAEADWSALASKHSIDPASKDKGGSLGWRGSRDFAEPLASAVRQLKPGTLSRPIHTSQGWHVVKVHQKRPNNLKPFEQIQANQAEFLKRVLDRIEGKAGDRAAMNAFLTSWVPPAPALRRLLELGADVNSVDDQGNSALHRACILGLANEAAVLVQAGAALDTTNKRGETPLQAASLNEKSGAIVALLLKHGVDPSASKEGKGTKAIHLAAMGDNGEAIRALVKAGADPNGLAEDGQTPLMWAANSQCPRAISALLAVGADPLILWTDSRGKSSLKYSALDLLLLSRPADSSTRTSECEPILRRATQSASIRRKQGSLKVTILQDGRHYEMGNGTILLAPRPFTLAFEVQGSKRVDVIAIDQGPSGSDQARLLERVKEILLSNMRGSAEDAKGSYLFLWSPDEPSPGYHAWGNSAERPDFTTYQETGNGFKATRAIDSFRLIPASDFYRPRSEQLSVLSLSAGDRGRPMLLVASVSEPMGLFEQATKHMVSSEIRWLDH